MKEIFIDTKLFYFWYRPVGDANGWCFDFRILWLGMGIDSHSIYAVWHRQLYRCICFYRLFNYKF